LDNTQQLSSSVNESIRISIVSHDQDELVNQLIFSISTHCDIENLYITVVRNTASKSRLCLKGIPVDVTILQNESVKGFGANHNKAFTTCTEKYFCVLNPDILVNSNIFNKLKKNFQNSHIGVVAPLLADSKGNIQDNARDFPTPWHIVKKVLAWKHKYSCSGANENKTILPDWIAGMFMLFPAHIFQELGGFDEHYFLYYEDVDICMRLKKKGYSAKLDCRFQAIHDARRASHRSLRYLKWHIKSMFRFFVRYPFYKYLDNELKS
jgi:N-acetylglucosaminyl-diphospho-decaprenol L-rhamnosyltransferase